MIYSVRETKSGYFVDAKDDSGVLCGTYLVTKSRNKFTCSCEQFQRTKNMYNHIHILVVKKWLESNKPEYARYFKDNNGKLEMLI